MIVVDIETAPLPGIMDTWYKDWVKSKYPEDSDFELEKRASLHGEFAMCCAIGFSDVGSSEVYSQVAKSPEEEKGMLVDFAANMERDATLVGHNIKGFDIPFLAKRYMAHDLKVPSFLRVAGKKPWEITHQDTMELMRFGGATPMSLRSACLLLGLGDPKELCSGADVMGLFKQGSFDTIERYVRSDVEYEKALYRKIASLAF